MIKGKIWFCNSWNSRYFLFHFLILRTADFQDDKQSSLFVRYLIKIKLVRQLKILTPIFKKILRPHLIFLDNTSPQ